MVSPFVPDRIPDGEEGRGSRGDEGQKMSAVGKESIVMQESLRSFKNQEQLELNCVEAVRVDLVTQTSARTREVTNNKLRRLSSFQVALMTRTLSRRLLSLRLLLSF